MCNILAHLRLGLFSFIGALIDWYFLLIHYFVFTLHLLRISIIHYILQILKLRHVLYLLSLDFYITHCSIFTPPNHNLTLCYIHSQRSPHTNSVNLLNHYSHIFRIHSILNHPQTLTISQYHTFLNYLYPPFFKHHLFFSKPHPLKKLKSLW